MGNQWKNSYLTASYQKRHTANAMCLFHSIINNNCFFSKLLLHTTECNTCDNMFGKDKVYYEDR